MAASMELQALKGSQSDKILFGAALVSIGAATLEDIERALEEARRTQSRLGDALLATATVTLNDILHARHLQGEREIDIERRPDLPEFDTLLSDPGGELGLNSARDPRFAMVTLRADRLRRAYLLVAKGEPYATSTVSAVQAAVSKGYKVISRLVCSRELLEVVFREIDGPTKADNGKKREFSDQQQKFLDLCYLGYKRRASDIHIWYERGKGTIALRVDGRVEYHDALTQEQAEDMFRACFNTLTETGSTQKGWQRTDRQDAVIEHQFAEGILRFRYAGCPIGHDGYRVALRIIPVGVETREKSFLELGYSPDQAEAIGRAFSRSSGMIVVNGTTGSGKSTTLANGMMGLARAYTRPSGGGVPGKLLCSVEEPIEYTIPGVLQTPVSRGHGNTENPFTATLRALMRLDPDVIMVGEIRDADTAALGIAAVRSGHLCVTTLHCDSALGIYDRFATLGVDRGDVAAPGILIASVYQKLVPVLCPKCKIPAAQLEGLHSSPIQAQLARIKKVCGSLENIFYRSDAGCAHCAKRGIIGRTVCAEILRPDTNMLKAVRNNDPVELLRLWRATINPHDESDMTGRTAFEHALWKMRQGIVAPRDVESEFMLIDEPVGIC